MATPYYSGLIVTYNCTASCGHCMFASRPHVSEDCNSDKTYMTYKNALEICAKLSAAGVDSMHIGGGEPFINFEGLCYVVRAMNECGIGIDYIETNCFWCKDADIAKRRILHLKELGVTTLMASLDPFHIEFVPLGNVVNFCNIMNEVGMEYFVWQDKFYKRLSPLDKAVTHTKEELCRLLGGDYEVQTASEYGLGMNGRALGIAEKMFPPKSADEIVRECEPCTKLLSGRHCHVDLYGRVTPSGCPGISVALDDFLQASDGFDAEKYPVARVLASEGVGGLLKYAEKIGVKLGEQKYPTKCMLCYNLRKALLDITPSRDIAPLEFYKGME